MLRVRDSDVYDVQVRIIGHLGIAAVISGGSVRMGKGFRIVEMARRDGG